MAGEEVLPHELRTARGLARRRRASTQPLMRSRFRSFSPSPQLPTYASVAALVVALFLGLIRFLLIGVYSG